MTPLPLRLYRWAFGRPRFFRFNYAVYHLALRGMGVLNFEDEHVSGESNFLRGFLSGRRSPIVLDVGANVGDFCVMVLRNHPGASVHAFEPHPSTAARLRQRAMELGNEHLRIVESAVGNRDGRISLFDRALEDGSSHASIHREVIEHLHSSTATSWEVDILTLDSYIATAGLEKIDLLKIDVEGHELAVLEGARRAIGQGRIEAIQFEFNSMNVVSRSFMRDFARLLKDYELFRLLPNGLIKLDWRKPLQCEIFAFQNIVAFKPGHEGRP